MSFLEMWFCLMDNYCIGTIVAPYEIYVPFVVIIYIFELFVAGEWLCS